MCNANTIQWFDEHLTEGELTCASILDVGSRNVNGSLREIVMAKGAAEYVGVDLQAGPGVDVVCDAGALVKRFGMGSFDIVFSACTLEHVQNLPLVVANMKQVCRPGGLLVVAVPGKWPRHEYPGDYWRFTLGGLCVLFGDCKSLQVAEVTQSDSRSLMFGKFRKPDDWKEQPGIVTLGI